MHNESYEQLLIIQTKIDANKQETDEKQMNTDEKLTHITEKIKVLTELIMDQTKNSKLSPD